MRVLVENHDFFIPFVMEKLEWFGYSMVKKFEYMFSCFDRIPACDTDGQTDGVRWTDGRADRETSGHSMFRAVHTRRAVKMYGMYG